MTVLADYDFMADLKEDHGLSVFVETGTQWASGVHYAVACGFDKVYSCELLRKFFRFASHRTCNIPHVELHKCDGLSFISRMIHQLDRPAMFWLDGHSPNVQLRYMRDKKVWPDRYHWPHMDELRTLRGFRYISESVVLVDDIQVIESDDNDMHEGFLRQKQAKIDEGGRHEIFIPETGYSVADMKATLADVLDAEVLKIGSGVMRFCPQRTTT